MHRKSYGKEYGSEGKPRACSHVWHYRRTKDKAKTCNPPYHAKRLKILCPVSAVQQGMGHVRHRPWLLMAVETAKARWARLVGGGLAANVVVLVQAGDDAT